VICIRNGLKMMSRRLRLRRRWGACACFVGMCFSAMAQTQSFPRKTGVQTAGVEHAMEDLPKIATIAVEGNPDWMAVTANSIWVTSGKVSHVIRIDPATNRAVAVVTVHTPCSGLAVGFGSLWVPSCGDKNLVRLDQETGALQATVPVGPADDEGGITAGAGSVWMVTSDQGELTRIDGVSNEVVARVKVPAGSFNPLFAAGSVWVSSNAGNVLIRVDPATNMVVDSTRVGPMPRFLTYGAGSIWVLNQGDGTVSRVDARTGKLVATIAAGIPGEGGEISFGAGAVWATEMGFPLTRIDPKTNKVVSQWHGEGGDSVRFAFGSVWLTDLKGEKVWRIAVPMR
jgi:virginiamycin B lyase